MKPPSPREMEIAELISFGATEKEISNYLDVAIGTVKAHKLRLFNKTGCRNIADVTRWYFESKSGIHIQPTEAAKRCLAIFFLLLIVMVEFSNANFIRPRVRRVKETGREICRTRSIKSKSKTYQLSVA